jgi:hypothetical protein
VVEPPVRLVVGLAAAFSVVPSAWGGRRFGLAGRRALAASDPRRTFAVLTTALGSGQIVGPVLAGPLHDRTGGFGMASLLAAGLLAAGAMALRVPPRGDAIRCKTMVQCGNPCSDAGEAQSGRRAP